jgi:ribosomal protein S18 acetylase RimI-like enzyme
MGTGRALVAQAMADARVAEARCLHVAVMPGNLPAIRFYEACGFTYSGEREIYAPHGREGGPEVALVYTRHLRW